jgi:hypothetical protein
MAVAVAERSMPLIKAISPNISPAIIVFRMISLPPSELALILTLQYQNGTATPDEAGIIRMDKK